MSRRSHFTPEEDEIILKREFPDRILAQMLGRSKMGIYSRRRDLTDPERRARRAKYARARQRSTEYAFRRPRKGEDEEVKVFAPVFARPDFFVEDLSRIARAR